VARLSFDVWVINTTDLHSEEQVQHHNLFTTGDDTGKFTTAVVSCQIEQKAILKSEQTL